MKLFISYLGICFLAGIFFANRNPKERIWFLLAAGTFVLIGYYFLHQI